MNPTKDRSLWGQLLEDNHAACLLSNFFKYCDKPDSYMLNFIGSHNNSNEVGNTLLLEADERWP